MALSFSSLTINVTVLVPVCEGNPESEMATGMKYCFCSSLSRVLRASNVDPLIENFVLMSSEALMSIRNVNGGPFSSLSKSFAANEAIVPGGWFSLQYTGLICKLIFNIGKN